MTRTPFGSLETWVVPLHSDPLGDSDDGSPMSTTGSSYHASPGRRSTAEGSDRTPELVAYFVSVIGVLLASAVVGAERPRSLEPWFYVALLTIGYMFSRTVLPRRA